MSGRRALPAGPAPALVLGCKRILFKLGATLHPWAVMHNRALVITSLVESAATFGAILGLMLLIGATPVVSVIAAAIAVSSSPAVLLHVAEELHARGPTMASAEALWP